MQVFIDMAILLVGTVLAALTFWNQILHWVDRTLFPWIKNNLPELEFDVRNAFAGLDKVITPIRNLTNIKKAWEKLREHLLKVLVQFDLNTRYKWVRRITYWVTRRLQSNKSEVVWLVTEEILDLDSLPPDVREEWLKRGNTTQDIDVTQLRDRELLLISEEVEEMDSLPDDLQQEWDVLSNSTTQNSSVEIQQKSHIKGLLSKILLEELRGELEELRSDWIKKKKSDFEIGILTVLYSLDMLKGQLQTKVENIWLPKKKQS